MPRFSKYGNLPEHICRKCLAHKQSRHHTQVCNHEGRL